MNMITLTLPVSRVTVSDGRATATASVTNGASVPARITLGALAGDAAAAGAVSWTLVDNPLRDIEAGATEQFTVTFAPPADVEPGSYTVRLVAYSADKVPEEYADQARQVEIVVPAPAQAAPQPKRPWWPIAAVMAVLLIVASVVIYLVLPRGGGTASPSPSTKPSFSVPILTVHPIPVQPATPTQISPANGTVFNTFPRTTKLRWSPVTGVASYTVEIDCLGCCAPGKWCADVGKSFRVVSKLTSTSFTFDFVGAQPGRWRVWAVSAAGTQSPKSPWWNFTYLK